MRCIDSVQAVDPSFIAGIRRNGNIGATSAFYGFRFSLALWTGLEHSRVGTFELFGGT